MPVFRLAIHQSGLQEYEGHEYLAQCREVEAPDLRAAIIKYANDEGLSKRSDWNAERLTTWGFPIVDIATMGDGWRYEPFTLSYCRKRR